MMPYVLALLADLGAGLSTGAAGATGGAAGATGGAAGSLVHETVEGEPIPLLEVVAPRTPAAAVPFADLGQIRAPGAVTLRFMAKGEAVLVPYCAGRGRILVDGTVRDPGSKGPLVVRLGGQEAHEVRVEVAVSAYEKRIACGEPPRAGKVTRSAEGLIRFRFASPHTKAGGGEAVVFVPKGHDPTRPGPLLVGTHPWNGGPWTYAAYRELLDEAQAQDIPLLMPSGLGNSLYLADAEDEVLRAIDALSAVVAVDPQRVSIWGASMGGAGATTIAFHHPDRFAFVASYFGDSKYDVTTYVRSLLPTEADARKVNALDVLDNARHLPVWLVHGEADRSSPVRQSAMLQEAMQKRGMDVTFDRVPGMGHEAPLVVKYIRRVVGRAEASRAPVHPARVSFRSVRASDSKAYGVRIVRKTDGDAFVDIERRADGVHVLATEGVSEIVLDNGALGAARGDAVHVDRGAPVSVRWE